MAKYDLLNIDTLPPDELDNDKIKDETKDLLEELEELQNLLYAEGKHSLLVILQGMDASGKDGVVRKVFGAVNPQGIHITSFKAPTKEELSHDFLWRIHKNVPEKGMIQIFNRSHYEDVLITRVMDWCDDKTAEKRFRAINDFEKLLQNNNTHVLKFYLHISEEEQKKRFQERLTDPKKHWKYNPDDLESAKHWSAYRKYYNEVFEKSEIIWNIIPADKNWYKEYLIAKKVVSTLKNLNMKYPKLEK